MGREKGRRRPQRPKNIFSLRKLKYLRGDWESQSLAQPHRGICASPRVALASELAQLQSEGGLGGTLKKIDYVA